ncbi:MFS transporter, partial [bacterium]|nr:MFS transporter [bacterium]
MNKNRIIENKNKESFVKKWGVVFVLSLALAIILIDSTVLNVSISVLIKELNTDIQGIQWIITLYSLVLASLTITGGRLGDLFGRKKMFVFGAIIFALGSLIAALSNSLGMLAFGWSVVEGIGAALMMPATASLLVSKFKGKDRNIAFGIWGGVAAASTAIGPLLGGYLTTNFSWRWAFAINIFVVLLVVIGSIYVSEYKDDNEKPTLDIFGVILSSLGLLSVVFGIIQSTDYGWIKAKQMFNAFGVNWDFSGYSISIVSIIIGLILLLIFMYWEARIESKGKTPLVSLKIFTNKQFNAGLATSMVMSLGQAGLIFSIPVFIQAVLGKDAFHTGLAMLPLSIAAFICAPLGGFLSHKIPPKYLVQFGLFLNFIGYLVLRSSFSTSATTSDLILGLIILGSGMGF